MLSIQEAQRTGCAVQSALVCPSPSLLVRLGIVVKGHRAVHFTESIFSCSQSRCERCLRVPPTAAWWLWWMIGWSQEGFQRSRTMFLHTETQRWNPGGPWVPLPSCISATDMEAFPDISARVHNPCTQQSSCSRAHPIIPQRLYW